MLLLGTSCADSEAVEEKIGNCGDVFLEEDDEDELVFLFGETIFSIMPVMVMFCGSSSVSDNSSRVFLERSEDFSLRERLKERSSLFRFISVCWVCFGLAVMVVVVAVVTGGFSKDSRLWVESFWTRVVLSSSVLAF